MKRWFEISTFRDGVRLCLAITLCVVAATLVFGELISYLLDYPANWKQYVMRAVIPLVLTPMVVIPLVTMNMRLYRLRAEMHKLARTDSLTGLLNRRAFFELGGQSLASGAIGTAVMMIDVDKFKSFNDTHGHDVGDKVLRMIANTVASVTKTVDVASESYLARIGGEEFALMTRLSHERAEHLAEAICAQVRACRCAYRGIELRATISVGLAIATGTESLESLLRAADTAVYEAKRQGRDRWCLATPAMIASGVGASHELRTHPRAA